MLGVVGSSLKLVTFEPKTPNRVAKLAQQCCNMLRWHVAVVWLGLNV